MVSTLRTNIPPIPQPKFHDLGKGFLTMRPKMDHYKGELPQSDFHFSQHLKWKNDDPSDSFSPSKAFSDVLGVWWEVNVDIDGRFYLTLNGMRVGQLNYSFPSIAQVLAERAEDSMRRDYFAYMQMLQILENSRKII